MSETPAIDLTQVVAQSRPDLVAQPTETAPETKSEATPEVQTEAKAEQPAPEVKEESVAKKFAAIEKKAAAQRAREHSAKEEIRRERERAASLEAELAKVKQIISKAKDNPWEYLETAGLDYNYLTEYALNNSKPPVEHKISEAEARAMQKIEQIEAKLKAAEEREAQARVYQFRAQLNEYIGANSEQFELVVANDAQDLVFDTIEKYAEKNEKLLPFEDACKMVEDFLTEQAKVFVPKLKKTKKLQDLIGSAKPPEKPLAPQAPTLTNKMQEAPAREDRPMTREERLAEAAKLIKVIN